MNPREAALAMIGKMPDDATWEDLQYQVYRCMSAAGLVPDATRDETDRAIQSWLITGQWRTGSEQA